MLEPTFGLQSLLGSILFSLLFGLPFTGDDHILTEKYADGEALIMIRAAFLHGFIQRRLTDFFLSLLLKIAFGINPGPLLHNVVYQMQYVAVDKLPGGVVALI